MNLPTLRQLQFLVALGETGSCVKVVRLSDGILLVDCSTGQQAVIR
jgi:hypothetical protein